MRTKKRKGSEKTQAARFRLAAEKEQTRIQRIRKSLESHENFKCQNNKLSRAYRFRKNDK